MKKIRACLYVVLSAFMAFCAISLAMKATNNIWIIWTIAAAFVLLTIWLTHRAWRLLRKIPQKVSSASPSESLPKYVYINFNVSGVTYNNEDGINRQDLLRKIKFGDEPFENSDSLVVALKPSTYKGNLCIECRVNDSMIGYVPKEMVDEVAQAIKKDGVCVSGFSIVGGGKKNGEHIHYGAQVAIRYET